MVRLSRPLKRTDYPSRRILEMVAVLHDAGYQRLRAMTAMSPSGIHWRCTIGPATATGFDDGSGYGRYVEPARYSSAQQPEPFGWQDAVNDDAVQLAAKFVARFDDVADAGRGSDPEYARWFQSMLELTEPNGLIYALADYHLPGDRLPVVWEGGGGRDVRIPFPPSMATPDS